jgi:hypothetical protein
MTNFIKCAFLVGVIFLLNGCAQRYTYIEPEKQFYKPMPINDGVEFSYKFDMLNEKGNTKFHANALRKEIKVVTVRIKNCTDSTINIARDLQFYSGNTPLTLLDPTFVRNQIKQQWYWYLGYFCLLEPHVFMGISYLTLASMPTIPFLATYLPYVIALGIPLGNLNGVFVANKNLLIDLVENDLREDSISKNETKYGIICFQEKQIDKLTVKLKHKTDEIKFK